EEEEDEEEMEEEYEDEEEGEDEEMELEEAMEDESYNRAQVYRRTIEDEMYDEMNDPFWKAPRRQILISEETCHEIREYFANLYSGRIETIIEDYRPPTRKAIMKRRWERTMKRTLKETWKCIDPAMDMEEITEDTEQSTSSRVDNVTMKEINFKAAFENGILADDFPTFEKVMNRANFVVDKFKYTSEEEDRMKEIINKCERAIERDISLQAKWDSVTWEERERQHFRLLEKALEVAMDIISERREDIREEKRFESCPDGMSLVFQADRKLGMKITLDCHTEIYYTIGNQEEERDLKVLMTEKGSARHGRETNQSMIKFRMPWLPEVFIGKSILREIPNTWKKIIKENKRNKIDVGHIDVNLFESFVRGINRTNHLNGRSLKSVIGNSPEISNWRTCFEMIDIGVDCSLEAVKSALQYQEEKNYTAFKRGEPVPKWSHLYNE
ncbi:hypothetical protein PFISCL1PPCAC_27178, partial [Pristionchus fissidentatus]